MFRKIGKDEVGRHWCNPVKPSFPELPFNIVLFRKTETSMGLQAKICGLPAGIGSKQLCHIRFLAAGFSGIKK